jgi:urease accessory protein
MATIISTRTTTDGMVQGADMRALVRLLWLASPALPVGAYGYSRGLEQAVARGYVHDESSLEGWVRGVLTRQLACLDAPVMVRVLRAARRDEFAEVARWSELLAANRESRELSLEDVQVGASLLRLLREQGVEGASRLGNKAGHATAFGVACAHYGVAEEAAVSAYLFSFAESQVTAALKCMLLGQTAGQRVLGSLIRVIDGLVHTVLTRDDGELGSFAPGLALLSALHETQYSRLFRS